MYKLNNGYYDNKDYEVFIERQFQRVLRLTKYAIREQMFELDVLAEKALEFFFCSPHTAKNLAKMVLARLRRRRDEGIYDFTQIMHEYSKYVLPEFLTNSKNTVGNRIKAMISEHVATDPRYQSRLDTYGINY